MMMTPLSGTIDSTTLGTWNLSTSFYMQMKKNKKDRTVQEMEMVHKKLEVKDYIYVEVRKGYSR
jgi:hypothetical protein